MEFGMLLNFFYIDKIETSKKCTSCNIFYLVSGTRNNIYYLGLISFFVYLFTT